LDYCADEFQKVREKYGPLAIAGIIGSQYRQHGMATNRFLRALGSPNILCDDYLCEGMQGIADDATVGEHITKYRYSADFENTKCILTAGCNLAVSYNPKWRHLVPLAKKNGAKLIVIDPKLTEPAEKADIHLRPRPGTDGALFLGMLNVIINEEIYDKEFVNNWCVGFEPLKERIQEYPLKRVEKITEIPAEHITAAARMFATEGPSCIHVGLGMHHYTNSTQTCRAAIILLAICGYVDAPGGNIFLQGKGYPGYVGFWDIWSNPKHRMPRETEEKRIGAKEYPLWSGPDSLMHCCNVRDVWHAMLTSDPYPLRAFFVCSSNCLLSHPEPLKTYKALLTLDFLPVVEFMMSPVAKIADIILPTTHWIEESGVDIIVVPKTRALAVRQPAIKPVGEARDTLQICADISQRMKVKGYLEQKDLDKYFPWKGLMEFLEWRLEKTGISYKEMAEKGLISCPPTKYRTYEQNGFHTPSGKVELYSSIFEKAGFDPLPCYQEPLDGPISRPDLTEEYPLILSTGLRVYGYQHSRYRDLPSLHKREPNPIVEISQQAAQERGISDGDWVSLSTRFGNCKFKARIVDCRPELVQAQHGWWYMDKPLPESFLESNGNHLIGYDPNDLMSSTPMAKGTQCQVKKL
jgi:anaerobic selenocysteine-containing dehydrogenase